MSTKKCSYHCKNGKILLEATRTWVDCPECRNINKIVTEKDEEGKDFYDILMIPENYKDAKLTGIELFDNTDSRKVFTNESMNEIVAILDRINKDVFSGTVTNVSCYIFVHNWLDIKQFVYGLQKVALEKGLGVVPYVSLNTLYNIQKVVDYNFSELSNKEVLSNIRNSSPDLIAALEGVKFVESTKLTYYDFKYSDLCIVEATSNTTEKGWSALADLLSERAKNNLPTYVMGYWSSNVNLAGVGLRYLINKSRVFRLDKLNTYELRVKSKDDNKRESISKVSSIEGFSNVKSGITAGINTLDIN